MKRIENIPSYVIYLFDICRASVFEPLVFDLQLVEVRGRYQVRQSTKLAVLS